MKLIATKALDLKEQGRSYKTRNLVEDKFGRMTNYQIGTPAPLSTHHRGLVCLEKDKL